MTPRGIRLPQSISIVPQAHDIEIDFLRRHGLRLRPMAAKFRSIPRDTIENQNKNLQK